MSMKILFITVLLFLVGSLSSAQNGRHPSKRVPRPCCKKFTNVDITVTEDTYRELPARSGCLEALLLTVEQGQLCVDPREEWVQNLITNMTKV